MRPSDKDTPSRHANGGQPGCRPDENRPEPTLRAAAVGMQQAASQADPIGRVLAEADPLPSDPGDPGSFGPAQLTAEPGAGPGSEGT